MEFVEIYDTHFQKVRSFIVGMTGDNWAADDLAQETFIRVRKNLKDLRDRTKLRPWIFQIARNICRDYFRKNGKKKLITASPAHDPVGPPVQIQMEQQQMSSCVQDKIQLLPETLRAVLVLADLTGLSSQEIADALGIKNGNVKVRLHRARNAMKDILKRECTFEHDERNVMVCLPKTVTAT
ncbi:RNA polymerase sigma factor [Thermodesulfobacteriota bacterium]